MAERFNIVIDQGSDFIQSYNIIHQTTGNPYDLTGFTIASEMRKQYSDALPTATFTASIATPPTSGSISIALPASGSMGIPADCYVYDIELTLGSSVVRIVEGKAIVSPEVTK